MPTFRNTLVCSIFIGTSSQTFSRTISYPSSFYSHLPAYEDGTDSVFRNSFVLFKPILYKSIFFFVLQEFTSVKGRNLAILW
jgi:hypothetical protein